MKFSEKWLREWVNTTHTTTEIVEQLTMLGLEVDGLSLAAPEFSQVIVGEVVTREQHPNADRLSLCQVNIGQQERLQIVCGAPNVRAGLKVAVVVVGGVLPGNFKIKKTKLRGIESQGMICSARELGLGDEHDGILELALDAPVGMNFREYLDLDDQVIDVDLTPNRGDCASLLGIARELAAVSKLNINAPNYQELPVDTQQTFAVSTKEPKACPRYVGRIISGIHAQASSPLWLQERLRRSGLRAIHPVVDVTNLVMLELGQPMHAFDLAKLEGGISVRMAEKNEAMTLLDGTELTLQADDLVIADKHQAQALAGVMGGALSAVDDNTVDIFLESAFFTPEAICQTARRYGLQTDSSYRFERGVDYQLQRIALERASELLLTIVGGKLGPIVEVCEQALLPVRHSIKLRRSQIKRLLGIEIADTEITDIFTALKMQFVVIEDGWEVIAPSHRFDIEREIDLIEELARLYGYAKIPTRHLTGELASQPMAEHQPYLRLQNLLVDRGYHEIVTYSFVDPELESLIDPKQQSIRLTNPLARDMAVMRTSLWPGLLQALQYNVNRQLSNLRLFEVGLSFKRGENAYQQNKKLAGLVVGEVAPGQWDRSLQRQADFYDIKGDVSALLKLSRCAADFVWQRGDHPALHPGQTAVLSLEDECVGYVGALHPSIVEALDLPVTPYLFELDWRIIDKKAVVQYQPVSRFPAVYRDLAVLVAEEVTAQEILQHITKFSEQLLNEAHIFDIYQGEGIEFGKKSVALGLTFQAPERTLTDREINQAIERIINGLQRELNATLRT